jgi:hypothetical protein
MVKRLDQPFQPSLPLAPESYSRPYQDQYSNVLRLYFNQLSNALRDLFGDKGGQYINSPYGAFHENGTTTLAANISNTSTTPIQVASTAGFPDTGWILIEQEVIQYTAKTPTTFAGTITRGVLGTTNTSHTAGVAITEVQGTGGSTIVGKVLFNNTDYSNGVRVGTDQTKVYFDYPGIYNLQFSAQLLNFTSTEDLVTIWLRKNGDDVAASAGIEQVNAQHAGLPGARIPAWNYLLDLNAGDYVQLAWSTNTGESIVATYPAGTSPVHPYSPAVIFTATFVSSIT